jgi:hypothetical protein
VTVALQRTADPRIVALVAAGYRRGFRHGALVVLFAAALVIALVRAFPW